MVSLVLAFSFGLYGLLRKKVRADALTGLTAETLILAPLAVGYLIHLDRQGTLVFGHGDRGTDALLALGGLITAMPLLWFANAARRLQYATVGFLQYIAPSLQFILAVFVFHEPLGREQMMCFFLIWSALALYTWDAVRVARRTAI